MRNGQEQRRETQNISSFLFLTKWNPPLIGLEEVSVFLACGKVHESLVHNDNSSDLVMFPRLVFSAGITGSQQEDSLLMHQDVTEVKFTQKAPFNTTHPTHPVFTGFKKHNLDYLNISCQAFSF